MNVSIKSCARCGQDHDNLEFSLFTHPVEDSDGTIWAYWAACPTNGEPILMRSQIKAETEVVNKPDWMTIPVNSQS